MNVLFSEEEDREDSKNDVEKEESEYKAVSSVEDSEDNKNGAEHD